MKLQIPFYLQTTPLNCGPVALKMVLEFLNKKYSIEELEQATGLEKGKAISTIKLAITAARLGFKAKFFSKSIYFNKENLKLDYYKNM